MNAVTVKNLTKVFRQGDEEIRAVDHISFTIGRGEFCVIVGPSGAGKTTVLNMLGGMDACSGGTITVDGTRVELTLKEFELLKLFLEHPGRVFTRDQLLERIWSTDYVGETRTVDVHIGTLRTKLGQCGEYIRTVRGVGYRMEA